MGLRYERPGLLGPPPGLWGPLAEMASQPDLPANAKRCADVLRGPCASCAESLDAGAPIGAFPPPPSLLLLRPRFACAACLAITKATRSSGPTTQSSTFFCGRFRRLPLFVGRRRFSFASWGGPQAFAQQLRADPKSHCAQGRPAFACFIAYVFAIIRHWYFASPLRPNCWSSFGCFIHPPKASHLDRPRKDVAHPCAEPCATSCAE